MKRCEMGTMVNMRGMIWTMILLVGFVGLTGLIRSTFISTGSEVPSEYHALFDELRETLEEFQREIGVPSEPRRITFAAELLSANAHRGEQLLAPDALLGATIYLDALASLGIKGVKVFIGYPLLAPNFPRAQEFLDFYKRLAAEIRRRRMVLLVGTGAMFRDPNFTSVSVDYSGLTFEEFKRGRRQVAEIIAREIRPDYLTIGNEPSTEARNTGLVELRDPQKYAELIAFILDGLDPEETRVGAGAGTWDDPRFIHELVRLPELDYIDLHIYPIVRGFLRRAVDLAELARAQHKSIIVGEAWLYKVGQAELGTETWSEAFRRDVFSFWEPLDQKFLEVIVELARAQGIEFMSAFWSTYFFAYLDYNRRTRWLPYARLRQLSDQAAVQNLLAGRFSQTGLRYGALIAEAAGSRTIAFRGGQMAVRGKSPRLKSIRLVQQQGARPRFSPSGDLIVFDRKNDDGFADVYLMDVNGTIRRSLTEGRPGVPQRHNGNAVFHPSGQYIVFVSETEEHFGLWMKWLGDPGLGLYANLWATTPEGDRFWPLTDIPIKRGFDDPTPTFGVVNPHFSPDGAVLVWTERYGEGGHHNWGRWQIKMADFIVDEGGPRLANERVILRAEDVGGNYVTSMGFFPDGRRLLLAGNLDGQHEYGMDQYILDVPTGRLINLHNSPTVWEEDASISPDGDTIVYMSNVTSRYELDFDDPNWPAQPQEREYWLMTADGTHKERLTYFNDPEAPEYLGRRTIVAASDISPNGKFLAGTLGVDFGTERRAEVTLKLVLMEFAEGWDIEHR